MNQQTHQIAERNDSMQNLGNCSRVVRLLLTVITIETLLLAPLSEPMVIAFAGASIYLAFTALISWDPVVALFSRRNGKSVSTNTGRNVDQRKQRQVTA